MHFHLAHIRAAVRWATRLADKRFASFISCFFLSQQHRHLHREPTHTHTPALRSLTHLPLPPHTHLLPLAGGGTVSRIAAPVSQPLVEDEAMLAAALHAEAKEGEMQLVCVLFQPHLLTLSPSLAPTGSDHSKSARSARVVVRYVSSVSGTSCTLHVRPVCIVVSCSVRGNAAVACTLFTCAHPFAFHSSHLPPTLNC